ncbi:MAG: geranylgeranyl reductase family protein [Nitriliruptorales bacterium]|nr:geranylgeranyl reductase family protein [Nitriliruptorales bacterium]
MTHADAVVIGAGPAGSAAAAFLADAGRDVILVEKDGFPRDKVCGDGLTPRAVKALQSLGLDEEAQGRLPGWDRQEGLRMYGGGVVLDLPWPVLDEFPSHSVTATRSLFDHTLARHAVKRGAQLWEETDVTGPLYLTTSRRRVSGVAYRRDGDGGGAEGVIRAPIVIVADGGSSRFAVQLGLHRDGRRPMGVAVRAYYRSPRSTMGMMEGFLDLRRHDGEEGELLPGYGWIFPLDDGLVNVGWGLISTSEHFRTTNYRKTLEQWVAGLPAAWDLSPDTMVGRPRSAGLPMGHNRRPPVHRGALLVGDSAGMVNPFNGEGISYAIEAAQFAAEAADDALHTRSDRALDAYAAAVADAWGGYYRLGHVFLQAMGHPQVMRLCTEYGMPRRRLMDFVFRTMAHLVNHSSKDATDLLINTLSRAVPAA